MRGCDRVGRYGRLCRPYAWGVMLVMLWVAPVQAMRIVSLAPSATETLFALGAGAEVVGVSTHCDYPPEALKIDKVGTFNAPSTEVILAKRPDLVIAVPSPGNRATVQTLERVGLKVLVVDPETVAGIEDSITVIADAIGRAEAGRALRQSLLDRIAAVQARVAGATPRRTLIVVGHTPLVGVGRGTFLDELIEIGGGTNIAAAAGGGAWPHLSLEFVLAQAPEVIIDTAMGSEGDDGEAWAFWKPFPTLPAVRDGRVRVYRDFALLRPGPRLPEALTTVASFIHPERFATAP